MSPTIKRALSVVAAVIIVVIGGAVAAGLVSSKEAPPKRERKRAVRRVETQVVRPGEVAVDVALQGRLVAFETVPLFAEVTGVFEESARAFKVGVAYRQGDLLARLEDTEARYTLLAQKAQLANALAQAMPTLKIDYGATFPAWDAYLRAFDPERSIPELPPATDDAARFYLNAQGIYQQYYSIKSAEERLRKYRLYAPVSGTLTEVSATVGALVRAGQPLGTLTANTYELAATVPVADLAYVKPGTRASLKGPNGEAYAARVSRVSTQVDPSTQTATLYLSVSGRGLREGLYLTGAAAGEALTDVVTLDQRLLVGDDEVYVLADTVLARQPVEVVRRGGDQVYVRGLPEGAEVLSEVLPGAYEGMKVKSSESEE